jgi:hypothetical protein
MVLGVKVYLPESKLHIYLCRCVQQQFFHAGHPDEPFDSREEAGAVHHYQDEETHLQLGKIYIPSPSSPES